MKAIWSYMLEGLSGGGAYAKRLGKCRRWEDFLALTDEILALCPPAEAEPSPVFHQLY